MLRFLARSLIDNNFNDEKYTVKIRELLPFFIIELKLDIKKNSVKLISVD